MNRFDEKVFAAENASLRAIDLETIQVNVGLTCDLHCTHCHVSAGPRRREQMSWETMEYVIRAVRESGVNLVDITGGAPEMNPCLDRFLKTLREDGVDCQVRSNLTIHRRDGYRHWPQFLASHGVWIVASLPCYSETTVDKQRGEGVYELCIEALKQLNGLGYGVDPALPLTLIYNPAGPFLPPSQSDLEEAYRHQLRDQHRIEFTRLNTIANMPIGRFLGDLRVQGRADEYQRLLEDNYNPATLRGLMCRHLISIDWEGNIHDCDFNLALKMPINEEDAPGHISNFDLKALKNRRIETGGHCFCCTAGCGTSCSGALV